MITDFSETMDNIVRLRKRTILSMVKLFKITDKEISSGTRLIVY